MAASVEFGQSIISKIKEKITEKEGEAESGDIEYELQDREQVARQFEDDPNLEDDEEEIMLFEGINEYLQILDEPTLIFYGQVSAYIQRFTEFSDIEFREKFAITLYSVEKDLEYQGALDLFFGGNDDHQKIIKYLHKVLTSIKMVLEQKRKLIQGKKIAEAKSKLAKQKEGSVARSKAAAKKELGKKRTKNSFCKNTIEYITQEDIEDIPTDELSFIKLDKSIFCFDKDSLKNMIKYSEDQKVRGNCNPPVDGESLQCTWYYPINIGQNVYIDEDDYEEITKKLKKKDIRKFELKNKQIVDFTTGLHMMSEKSGTDVVYDLVVSNFSIPKMTGGACSKLTVDALKKLCKKNGITGYSKMNRVELIKKCDLLKSKSPAKKLKSKSPVKKLKSKLPVKKLVKAKTPEQKKKEKVKKMSVVELKALCKKKGIKGYSKMTKVELEKTCLKSLVKTNKRS